MVAMIFTGWGVSLVDRALASSGSAGVMKANFGACAPASIFLLRGVPVERLPAGAVAYLGMRRIQDVRRG